MLHSVPLYGSGSGTYVRKLAEEFSKSHEVCVIYPGPPAYEKYITHNIEIKPVPVFTSHPTEPSRSFVEYDNHEIIQIISLYLSELSKLLEKFQPDIIHVQHLGIWCPIASMLKSLLNVPVVVTAHGTGLFVIERDSRFESMIRKCCADIDEVIAVSDSLRDKVVKTFPSLKEKSATIPGGVDLSKYSKPSMSKEEWRSTYNLKDKVILYVGRLIEEKGVQHLINVASAFPDAIVVISGSGGYENALKEMAIGKENVLLLPHLKDKIVDFFIHSDVLCVPSIWEEALGLVILEAMAAGTPVVASNIGGIPTAVKDGETGLLFEPGDEQDMKSKIKRILENPALSEMLSKNALKMVEEKFSWETIAGDVLKIYEKLI
ncbi:glycosyltransferase family 4 protein [Kosmotoga pacifica]|nr:glycosyltransferase family 4 protein [Kosmotoga pacifica]